MLEWDDSMTTGIQRIDAQHKEIIKKYNEFSAALSSGISRAEEKEEAGNILDFLQFYAQWHFHREEECFAEYECPAAEMNKKQHGEFLEMFGNFYEQWQSEGMDNELVIETYRGLGDWIQNHIMRTDTQIFPCVK